MMFLFFFPAFSDYQSASVSSKNNVKLQSHAKPQSRKVVDVKCFWVLFDNIYFLFVF